MDRVAFAKGGLAFARWIIVLAAAGCSSGDDDSSGSTVTTFGTGGQSVIGTGGNGAGGMGTNMPTTTGTGGTTAAGSGGMIAVGGAGGMGMVASGSGGMLGTGGMMAPSGTGGSGPMPGDGGPPPAKSMGCGSAATPPASGMQMLDVSGTQRAFIVTVPDNYDANTAYKLIFAWHGLGGMATQIQQLGYYGLQQRAMNTVIFVAAQGLDTSNQVGSGPGWDNMGGRDVAFTSAMLEYMRTNYCVDNERIFSVGMSYGGIMSNTVGCALGDDFRAIAPMSGAGPSAFGGAASCTGQVAAWLSHGNMDNVVQFSSGQASRDHWVMANHCDASMTQPEGSNGCIAYQGCDAGYPVVWCEFSGGHTVPPFATDEIWTFFSQF